MSRYAQPQLYGQVTYPPPGYTQPAMHGYHYPPPPLQMPPQMPVYHLDPNAFRRDYALRLTELNVNSSPIIQTLSMYAQEYSRWADIVAQCIEAHIRRGSGSFSTSTVLFHSSFFPLLTLEDRPAYRKCMYCS